MDLLRLIILATIGEAVWESSKLLWDKGKLSADRVGALFFGLLLAVGTGMDLLQLVGIPMNIPYVGMILTGILLSRGANFVHGLLSSIDSIKTNSKTNAAVIQILTSQTLKDASNIIQTYSQPTETKPVANTETTVTLDSEFPESKSTITLATDAGTNDK